jgi:hypothetical protein
MVAKSKDSRRVRGLRAKAAEVFGADLRSLALFRIVLALLVPANLANRATDLSAHYTDAGVLPRSDLIEQVLSRWSLSLNLMNGQSFFQALLFGVAALAALGLLVGYRTRLMNFVVWALVLSIQMRNPLVNGLGETLLHLLLFWGMFLPLGAYWSVDRARKAAPPRLSMRFVSLATAALFLQIAFVYWFAAIWKSGPQWREDGTALFYVLSFDQITTPFGSYLLHFPKLLEVMTFATIGFEAFGPFLLFYPFFNGPVRTAAVLAFMSLHFGIWLTMDIGIFPWISAFCMVCFLPGWFWEKAAKLRDVLADGSETVRRLRRAWAHLARVYWSPLWMRFSNVADLPAQENRLGSRMAHVFVRQRPVAGMLRHGETSPAAAEADDEQRTRYDTAPAAGPMRLRSSLATSLLAAFLLLYVFCWNLATVSALKMPEQAVPLGPLLGLDQAWGMFAPSPPTYGGWYVIPGTLRGGQQVDLMPILLGDFGLHKVSWEKPRYIPSTFKNEHWRKYFELIGQDQNANQRLYLGGYICRQWNARHAGAEQLETLQIDYMLERTLPDDRHTAQQKKVLLAETSCS